MRIKFPFLLFAALFIAANAFAHCSEESSVKSPLNKELFYAPAGLLTLGLVIETAPSNVIYSKYELQRRLTEGDRENKWDDYAQFLPMAGAIVIPSFLRDTETRSSLPVIVSNTVFSEALMLGTVSALKSVTNKTRPNGSSKSFPSGHTAQSFMGAQILYLEYRDSNKWIAYGGYPVAAFVAAERVDNDFHWTSDVLVGAAIGIAVPNLVYWLSEKAILETDKGFWSRHSLTLAPSYSRESKGLNVGISF